MKIRTLLAILAAFCIVALPAKCQTDTNTPAPPVVTTIWDMLTTGTNYFAVAHATMATSGGGAGGGLSIGYRATPAIAPIIRFDWFDGQCYLVNANLQLQVPRQLMGKFPIIPFGLVGAGTPLTTEHVSRGVTVTAGDPVGIIGIGAYVPFDSFGNSAWLKKTFVAFDYEHWTGAGIGEKQQNQMRFGLGVKF